MPPPVRAQSGLSRELFERWCADKRNGLMMPGYTVAGTLGNHVMSEPTEITTQAGDVVPVNLSIEYISFSAHSDYTQTSGFIEATRPRHVVLVHGSEEEMRRLRGALTQQFGRDQDGRGALEVLTPRNCQMVQIAFHAQRVARAVGAVAKQRRADGAPVEGLLVRRDFGYQLLADGDLAEHTELTTVSIVQRPTLPFHGSHAALRAALAQIFSVADAADKAAAADGADGTPADAARPDELRVCVGEAVTLVASESQQSVQLEWSSGTANDMIADAVASLVLRLESEAVLAQQGAMPSAPLAASTAALDGNGAATDVAMVKAEPGAEAAGAAGAAGTKRQRFES